MRERLKPLKCRKRFSIIALLFVLGVVFVFSAPPSWNPFSSSDYFLSSSFSFSSLSSTSPPPPPPPPPPSSSSSYSFSFPVPSPSLVFASSSPSSSSSSSSSSSNSSAIHVVMTFESSNSNYFRGMEVTIFAMYSQMKQPERLQIHLICLTKDFRTAQVWIAKFHPLAIPQCGLLEVRAVEMSRFPIKLYQAKVSHTEKRFVHPLNILHHLYTAKIYPDLPRVIIIDTDTLVVADIANLWEEIDSKSTPNVDSSNLTSDPITSSSPTAPTFVWGLNHTQLFGGTFTTLCKKLRLLVSNNSLPSPDAQFTDQTHFHSTGVLVMNIAAWVEFGVVEKIEMFMLHAIYSDIPGGSLLDLGVTRPLLNCYFAGVFNDFATKWNSQAGCHSTNPNAGILHWAGDDKPWTSGCPAPLWAQEEKLLRQSLPSS